MPVSGWSNRNIIAKARPYLEPPILFGSLWDWPEERKAHLGMFAHSERKDRRNVPRQGQVTFREMANLPHHLRKVYHAIPFQRKERSFQGICAAKYILTHGRTEKKCFGFPFPFPPKTSRLISAGGSTPSLIRGRPFHPSSRTGAARPSEKNVGAFLWMPEPPAPFLGFPLELGAWSRPMKKSCSLTHFNS